MGDYDQFAVFEPPPQGDRGAVAARKIVQQRLDAFMFIHADQKAAGEVQNRRAQRPGLHQRLVFDKAVIGQGPQDVQAG